jgi:phosphohistidine phosphatase
MTRQVYFLRHGKAHSRASWPGDDDQRPLTEAGELAVRQAAHGMRKIGVAPDVIVTSPLARARRTAEIVAEELGMPDRLVDDKRLAHGFDARSLAKIVARRDEAGSIMVVGHEPEFSAAVAQVIGGGRVELKKGALALVQFDGTDLSDGVLAWLLTPAQLGGE